MPSTNERITQAAWKALRGELKAYGSDPGFCLAWVRTVIEHALDWPSHALYDGYVNEWVQPPGYDRSLGHWARDAERALRNQGMAVHEAQPGDLVFNWKAAWSERWGAYIGHVGIVMEHDLIAENINRDYRPGSLVRGALALTPRSEWAKPTTVIRFRP